MSINTPTYESSRPRKRRSYPYRLPLGAFCCILIWFFAVFIYGNSSDEPQGEFQFENLPQAVASSEPFNVYDFQAGYQSHEMLFEEIAGAIHYYSLVTRKSLQPVAEAQILLPDSFPYHSFMQVIQLSRAENLHLAVGTDRRLILKKAD